MDANESMEAVVGRAALVVVVDDFVDVDNPAARCFVLPVSTRCLCCPTAANMSPNKLFLLPDGVAAGFSMGGDDTAGCEFVVVK